MLESEQAKYSELNEQSMREKNHFEAELKQARDQLLLRETQMQARQRKRSMFPKFIIPVRISETSLKRTLWGRASSNLFPEPEIPQ